MNLFDLSLIMNGFPIKKAEKHFGKIISLTNLDLTLYQEAERWKIFSYHGQHNPFYRKTLNRFEPTIGDAKHWQQIPIIDKQQLQGDISQKIALPFQTASLFRSNTSGSSGVPMSFAKDKYCHALTWASVKHRFGLHQIDFNRHLQARFYGIPLRGKKYYREKIKDFFSHRIRFPVFNLDDATCEKYLSAFVKHRFVYLNGYTSSLVLFAKYCLSRNVVLNQICPTLRMCFTTSEVCSDVDRAIMQRGFGVTVVNEYGAAELDLLAVEDVEGNWVINEETVYMEVVDNHGQPLPDGETGDIVVTALYNKAFPLIRYRLGDRGAIADRRTATGRRILQRLEGRINDIAHLPSGRKVPGLTFYYVTKSLLEKGSEVKEFVVKQMEPDLFRLEYLSSVSLSEEEQSAIVDLMALYLEPNLRLQFVRVDKMDRTRVGKLRQFQSLVQTI